MFGAARYRETHEISSARTMKWLLPLSFGILISLQSSNAQSSEEARATQFIDICLNHLHSCGGRGNEEDVYHIRDHPSLYVRLIKEELGLPLTDSLIEEGHFIREYTLLLPVLWQTYSPEAKSLLKEVYYRSSVRLDSLWAEEERIKAESPLDRVMLRMVGKRLGALHWLNDHTTSYLGYFNDDQILEDAKRRYDVGNETIKAGLVGYIRHFSDRSEVEKWLRERGKWKD